MKKIYFIRHAESVANATGIMAGKEYESPLTEKGKQQALGAGRYLDDKGIQLIMTSPMERTRHTAKIIAEEIGLKPSQIIENPLILERGYGNYSGRLFQDYVDDVKGGRVNDSVELPETLFVRVNQAFEWLAKRPEEVILVVSHGATGRMFRLIDQKLHHSDYHKIQRFGNAEIDEFTI